MTDAWQSIAELQTVRRNRTAAERASLWPKEQREMQGAVEVKKVPKERREAQRAYSALYRAQGKAHRAYLRVRREALAAIYAVLR